MGWTRVRSRMRWRRRDDPFERLVRQAREGLDRLGLPNRFTAERLHERMQEYRGREVRLIAQPLPPDGPHGLWVAGEFADYVFYPAAASPVRRHVIVGHEYGHMLFDVPPAAARLARTSYAELPEWRAEIFGTLVAERVSDWSAPVGPVADGDVAALRRLAGLLEQPGR